MVSDDVLDREEVKQKVRRLHHGGGIRLHAALLAHDAALRARIEELEGLIGEAASTVEQSMPSELRDTLLNEWVPRARRALDKGEDDGE